MEKLNAFQKTVTSSFSTTISPFASRTQQFVKEQLGQAEDKFRIVEANFSLGYNWDPKIQTQLPPDYIALEKRVDALKQVHQKLLGITTHYGNETYDYPPNIRESFTDLQRNITEKISLLSTASTPAEAGSALTAPSSQPAQPKTFSHALGRASLASSQMLPNEDLLSTGFEKYALASEAVGEARLKQDQMITTRFNAGFSTTLNTGIKFAEKARRNVENARLLLDAAKAKQKNSGGPGIFGKKDAATEASEEEAARLEVEHLEDEFVSAMEESVNTMKNVLDTPEPLRNLAELVNAQLEYHKRAAEILTEAAATIDGLQVDQESNYRKSREES